MQSAWGILTVTGRHISTTGKVSGTSMVSSKNQEKELSKFLSSVFSSPTLYPSFCNFQIPQLEIHLFVTLREKQYCVCVCVCASVVSSSFRSHGPWPSRLLSQYNSLGKNTGVGCHFFLQGIVPNQRSNPGLLHCGQIHYHLGHQGSPSSTINTNK